MEKTNFTFVKALRCLFLPMMMLFSFNVVNGQTLACNDNVQISVPATPTDGTCTVEISADMISEANDASNWVALFDGPQAIGVAGAPATLANSDNYFGETITVRVYEGATATGNFCWGSLTIEDKAAPVCNVTTPLEVDCNAAVPAVGSGITAADNCSGASIELTDVSTNDDDNCTAGTGANNAGVVVITRTYVAIDAQGNVSAPCVQQININRVVDVDFPEDIAWNCDDYGNNNSIVDAAPLSAQCNPAILGDDSDDIDNTLDGTEMGAGCLANTGSGTPSVAEGVYCKFAVTHDDDVLELCGNNPNDNLFKIIRTWSVLDWCTNTVVTTGVAIGTDIDGNEDNIQIIKVVDIDEVVITVANTTVSANVPGQHPQPCKSTGALPVPTLSDNCDNAPTYQVFTEIGPANFVGGAPFIPSPGLTIGDHDVTYVATDACGNTSEVTITVTVVDDITPSPVCDEITQVAVGSDGIATVYAETFDDGSNDNCGIDFFSVRRMSDACGISGNTVFGPSVDFCCADVGSTVMVALRVTDYYGNSNQCMVEVLVEDKIAPTFSCTSPAAVSCDDYFANLAPAIDIAGGDATAAIWDQIFAAPSFNDNCGTVNFNVSVNANVNNCGQGTVTRTFTAINDGNGNNASPASCTQTLNVFHVNDWSIQFPADIDVTCEQGEPMDFGEPTVFDDDCELVAISAEDQTFDIVPDACYKIVRTYTAINWCIYDGQTSTAVNFGEAGNDDRVRNTGCPAGTTPRYEDGGQDSSNGNANPFECADLYLDGADTGLNPLGDDGIVVYIQTIKIQDVTAPTFPATADLDFCIDGTDASGPCVTDVELPLILADDCAGELTPTVVVTGAGYASTGLNHANLAPGTYNVELTATDECGNQNSTDYQFTVSDCKAPTPYCVGGLVVELMDSGMVELWANDFDAGSFDNCTAQADLKLFASLTNSFSAAQASTGSGNDLVITCADLNGPASILPVYLFIQDEAGNVDVCQTSVAVETTTDINPCNFDDPIIAGALMTENDAPLAGATVALNSGESTVTNAEGTYSILATEGSDVTVTPEYNVYDNTSVTTFDLVLIKQHILTTNLLDSPYKMIAADVNNNGAITAADLVAAKQVILGMATEYAGNNAFVFVNAAQEFAADWTLADGYNSVASFNNITAEQAANFVAVRVGDVNGTYGFGDSADERNSMIINATDAAVVAGQEVTVEFSSADAVVGYQFTLNFAGLEVVSVNGNAADFGVFADAITVSKEEKTADNLFSVTFRATADVNISEAIRVSSNITAAEAYNGNGAMNVVLEFANENADFALYQNTPNPVKEATVIGFNLPAEGNAVITVSDMTGKVVTTVDGEYAKGYNEVTLRNLPAGVLTYTLENADFTATKTMVVVK